MKRIILLLSLLLTVLGTKCEEGMYIPALLQEATIGRMQAMGLKLSAEDIYSINRSSMKDAIVLFGRGCTGEIVSPNGLLLTNHHCGYGSIQSHSTLEHDYLTTGFWARDLSEELPNPSLTVTFLVRMEDVTEAALKGVKPVMTEKERGDLVKANIAAIEKEAVKESCQEAKVRPFYYGNQYYLLVTETYKDVRLVGAPPSAIGKFGGDTDNWMWPRHTGDFSVFRIYAGKDNKPAAYSPDNVPYKPKYYFPVSLKGYKPGDFTFVFGYPGTTREYLPSRGVELVSGNENPVRIRLREMRLNIIDAAMAQDRLTRIQYSSKAAGIANYWKKMIGESKGINRMDGIAKKQEFERSFVQWVNQDEQRKARYSGLLPAFEKAYSEYLPLDMAGIYLTEAGTGAEFVRFSASFVDLAALCQKKDLTQDELDKELSKRIAGARDFYKNYSPAVDRKIFDAMLPELARNIDQRYLPNYFTTISGHYKGDLQAFSADIFTRSLFTDSLRLIPFLKNFKATDGKKIQKDPAYLFSVSVLAAHSKALMPALTQAGNRLDSLQRIYMSAQMEMQPGRGFYPDANSTLRVSFGKVDGYGPADAVVYRYFTTTEGILQKEDSTIYDYQVSPKLKELILTGDYGRYADSDGSMHVAFTASNHTTGGNSGSPVLNADGELIGLNFDRDWEGTMSDLIYDPDQCRNITLDIRYCLFVMDKYAGAKHLVDEMTLRD